ncbi:hypothetical protein ACL02U_16265 [Streptomyces sp. MS06]|uniref:hypothetical protein n=1 Tax=Streptomyces sp. MS06 TaxID=3385974 RepID=UPI0039A12A8C
MGRLKATLCASAAAALTVLGPAVYAADGGGVAVVPSSPAPGTDVALTVRGCTGRTGLAVSPAFVAEAHLTGVGGRLTGESRVRSALRPGSYDLRITCGENTVRGTVQVVGKPTATARPPAPSSPRAPSSPPAPAFPAAPSSPRVPAFPPAPAPGRASAAASASPVAPVRAGGGGAARLVAAEARVHGPGTVHAVIGLVLAGVAAVAVAVRSVRRDRGTD